MKEPKIIITIEVMDENEKLDIVTDIVNQLVDNDDYIKNNIMMNYSTPNMIDIYIYEECKELPRLVFPKRESE